MAHKERFLTIRIALFVFGLGIVVLAALLLLPGISANQLVLFFTAVDAALLFGVLVGPLLVGESLADVTAGRIVSIGMLLHATVPYAIGTAALMLYANTTQHPPMRLIIVVQLALMFGLMLWVYFGMLTKAHIEDVAADERALRSSVDLLRSTSEQLAISAERIKASQTPGADSLVQTIHQIAEELRYLSPVASREAEGFERQIGSCLTSLTARFNVSDFTAERVRDANVLAQDTLTLIHRRKALRG